MMHPVVPSSRRRSGKTQSNITRLAKLMSVRFHARGLHSVKPRPCSEVVWPSEQNYLPRFYDQSQEICELLPAALLDCVEGKHARAGP